jgi:zinc protease
MKHFTKLLPLLLVFVAACTQPKNELELQYEQYSLDNGLDVILHVDKSDPIVSLAVQYHVGSNREELGHTGFAHLFEHMMFQRSENVGEDQFFKLIQDAGGTLNGGTGNDATTYYEVVPKNALEKILWMESDRMGYMINTVTQKAFSIQQNVVQNEKRQSVDNRPYGHTRTVIAKYLYPEGHPYSWTVIGEMEDLFNATVDDVKEFHQKYYVPNNATLVLAGDFDIEQTKQLIGKYFGEIPRGNDVSDPKPMPISLAKTIKVYHEDNFARTAQFRMTWPTIEEYSDDSYALDYLGELFSKGKKAPMYKVLEKEKQLSSRQYAYNSSQELAGTFNIMVTANGGVSLANVETAVFEAMTRFETEGFTEADVERIKAGQETSFYNGISSVLSKSFRLARYSEYAGGPEYYKTDIEKMKSVTREDILRVYDKYVKGKPYLATSFVPRGMVNLVAEGSVKADVEEEDISNATSVDIEDGGGDEIARTESSFDRSLQPADGPMPNVNLPTVYDHALANGIHLFGIEHKELPLVTYMVSLKGGHYLDQVDKAGVAYLLAELMMEGTANKTPQELEEAIESLGANISLRATDTEIYLSVNTLASNYDKTLALVEEILLQPRWDAEEFALAKKRLMNRLMRSKADPNTLASEAFSKLVYGEDHIFSTETSGSEVSVAAINMEDLKAYYQANFSPSVANFLVAGDVSQSHIIKSLESLTANWAAKDVTFPEYNLPEAPEASKIYFVDVPGAKQSVINIGNLGLARTNPDFYPAYVMNYKLGGSFSSFVNLVLREEKGFTYGARTSFRGSFVPGVFKASSSVRSSATTESVTIFKDLMTDYSNGISAEDLVFTQNALNKSNAREFETLYNLLAVLRNISTYNLPKNYVADEEAVVNGFTIEKHKDLAAKYIQPNKMYYVVAGDAATQLDGLKTIGFGDPVLLNEWQ